MICHKHPVTCHKHPMTCNKHPVTCHKHPVTCHKHPMTCHKHPVACHKNPMTCHKLPVTCHKYPMTCHKYPMICHKHPIFFSILKRTHTNWITLMQTQPLSPKNIFQSPHLLMFLIPSFSTNVLDANTILCVPNLNILVTFIYSGGPISMRGSIFFVTLDAFSGGRPLFMDPIFEAQTLPL
jgi:hypothetical protein